MGSNPNDRLQVRDIDRLQKPQNITIFLLDPFIDNGLLIFQMFFHPTSLHSGSAYFDYLRWVAIKKEKSLRSNRIGRNF